MQIVDSSFPVALLDAQSSFIDTDAQIKLTLIMALDVILNNVAFSFTTFNLLASSVSSSRNSLRSCNSLMAFCNAVPCFATRSLHVWRSSTLLDNGFVQLSFLSSSSSSSTNGKWFKTQSKCCSSVNSSSGSPLPHPPTPPHWQVKSSGFQQSTWNKCQHRHTGTKPVGGGGCHFLPQKSCEKIFPRNCGIHFQQSYLISAVQLLFHICSNFPEGAAKGLLFTSC